MKRSGTLQRSTPLRAKLPMSRGGSTPPREARTLAPRAKLKTKQRTVTSVEKVVWSKLAALGCIACMKDGRYNPHVSIHHVDGRTKPGCHMLVLPLCGPHHQDDGSGAVAVHPWKAQFEERYGAQLDLVAECMKMIEEKICNP